MRHVICGILLTIVMAAARAQEATEPITITYDVDSAWLELPSVAGPDGGATGTTYNAFGYTRALHPGTDNPIGKAIPDFECNPADVRRSFRLEKRNLLLGEPILVEYRVELDGPGTWKEPRGGTGRMSGRDGNFYFILQHEDGRWVGAIQVSPEGGGWVLQAKADSTQPYTVWQAVQRWCAIQEPGRYALYCFYAPPVYTPPSQEPTVRRVLMPDDLRADHSVSEGGDLIETSTGKKSTRFFFHEEKRKYKQTDSPLLAHMPPAIQALLEVDTFGNVPESLAGWNVYKHALWHCQTILSSAQVYAHFPIEIRVGEKAERAAMVDHWREAERALRKDESRSMHHGAVLDGIRLSLSDDFVPLFEEWIAAEEDPNSSPPVNYGLVLSNSPRTIALALDQDAYFTAALGARSVLSDIERRALLQHLVAFLVDDNPVRRMRALERLRGFAGGWFLGNGEAPETDPSPEELREAQTKWSTWVEEQPSHLPSYARGAWGYVDPNGAMVIAPQFTAAGRFEKGIATVYHGEHRFYIDRSGKPVEKPESDPGEGPYRFKAGKLWGYKDGLGTVVLPPTFYRASTFRGGRATVLKEGRTLVIDKDGLILFGDKQDLDEVYPDGTMTFTVPLPRPYVNAYGLLDHEGHLLLAPQYASIGAYAEGLVKFSLRDDSGRHLFGFADPKGNVVIPATYSDAEDFSEGRAAVRVSFDFPERWGYIDKSGTMVIEAQFRHVGTFSGGLASASGNGESGQARTYGFLNLNGEWAIEPIYRSTQMFSEGLAAVMVDRPRRWLDEP
mgnify:CR=1 FL=1